MLYINVPVLCLGYICLVYDRYCATLFLCLWFYVKNIFILHGPVQITRILGYIHMHFDFFKRLKKKLNCTLQFKLLSFRIIHKIQKTASKINLRTSDSISRSSKQKYFPSFNSQNM